MWFVMVSSASPEETDPVGLSDEEGQISVLFWSATFVLLLIVTVWFYITQIAPIRKSRIAGEIEEKDKDEEVAKRILEHLGNDLRFDDDVTDGNSVECTASTSNDNLERESHYEYIDDEIHIHYTECAWEDEGYRMSYSLTAGATRRYSMENMDLIFPGFLPSIVEEDEDNEETVSESSEESQAHVYGHDLADTTRVTVLDHTVNNNGGTTAMLVDKESKVSVTKNPFPTENKEKKISETIQTKHSVMHKASAQSRHTKATTDESTKGVNKEMSMDDVKTNSIDSSLMHFQTDSRVEVIGRKSDEITPSTISDSEVCMSATKREVSENFTSGDFDICQDKQNSKRKVDYTMEVNGDLIESPPVFMVPSCDLSQTFKQNANEDTELCKTNESQVSCSSENGTIITRDDFGDKHVIKVGNEAERLRNKHSSVPKEDNDGLDGNVMEITMDNATCKSNGFLDHVDVDDRNEQTTHAWTFFSMSGTDEETVPQNGITAHERPEEVEIPKIVIDSYEHGLSNDTELNPELVAGNGNTTFMDTFETDIDVDDIAVISDDELEDIDGEFSVYFKRNVSVTDLDKILAGEPNDSSTGSIGNVLETELSADEPYNEGSVDKIIRTTTEITNKVKTHDFDFVNESEHIDIDPNMNIHRPVIITAKLSDCVDKQGSGSDLEDSICSSPDASPKTYAVETILNELSFHKDGVYGELALTQFADSEADPFENEGLESFGENWSGYAEISGTEVRQERRANLFTIPEDKEIGREADQKYIRGRHEVLFMPGQKTATNESGKKELSAPIATIEASDSEFDLDDLEERSGSETEQYNGETVRDLKRTEERDIVSDLSNKEHGVTHSRDSTVTKADGNSRSVTLLKKVKIMVTKEVKVEREEPNLVERSEASAQQLDHLCNTDEREDITHGETQKKTPSFHWCPEDNEHDPYNLITETEETHVVSEPNRHVDEKQSIIDVKADKMEVATKTELPLPLEIIDGITTPIETTTLESSSPGTRTTENEQGLPQTRTFEAHKGGLTERTGFQSKVNFDTMVDVHADLVGSNIGIDVYVTGKDEKGTKVLSKNIRTEIPQVDASTLLTDKEERQSEQTTVNPSTVRISVQGKDPRSDRENRRNRSPRGTPRSLPKPWEPPRKTYLSSLNIRLTKSHEDLRFIPPQTPEVLKETSFIEEEPKDMEKVPEEDRKPEGLITESVASTGQTERPLSSASSEVNLAVPQDDAIESVGSDTIHTAKITVQEVVGNTKRITILNVRKKVHGTARWKSLNDLDSIAALPRRQFSDLWNGMTCFTEEDATNVPNIEEKEITTQEKPRKPIRVEVKAHEEPDLGYGTWDKKDTLFRKTDSLTTSKHPVKVSVLGLSSDRSVSSTSSIDGDKEYESDGETLGASNVMVTDLDALLSQEASIKPRELPPSPETQEVKEKVHVWARMEPVLESAVRIEKEDPETRILDKDEEPVFLQPVILAKTEVAEELAGQRIIVAEASSPVEVAVEPVILAKISNSKEVVVEPTNLERAADTKEEAGVISAFSINDGYDDDELDEVFIEEYPPGGLFENSETMESHSSDADSETSSVNSMPLRQRHRQTRSALEAAKAASNPGARTHSESSRSSGTVTPVAELENLPHQDTSSGPRTPESKANEIPREESFTFKPVETSRSTTRVIVKTAELTSTSTPVSIVRPRPRSELFTPKSDEEVHKITKELPTNSRDVQTLPGLGVNKRHFKEAIDSRKSMPDLSMNGQALNDSPYLRGLSAHTRKWLSLNVWMDPSGPQDEDDLMSSDLFLYPSNKLQPGSNIDASFLSLAHEVDFPDDISVSTVSTRPQSPMSEFSFAGEAPYWGLNKGSTTVLKCSSPRCGREEVLYGPEKTSYTSCPACFTYYCTRACRRIHWSEHKKVCFFGRINSYIRSFIYLCHKKETLKFQLSKIARDGLKKRGRGSVMVTFATAQSARKFMTTGCTFFPSPPTYSSLVDLQAEGVISKHRVALTQHIKDYDPNEEFVLNLAIIAGKMENLPENPVPRRKVNTVLQVVKVPLSNKLKESSPVSSPNDGNTETKVFYLPKCARHEFVNENEARRHYCRNISKSLKQYGIRLKHDYPDAYDKLCLYVEQNIRFSEPLVVYGNLGKKVVVCKIMPEAAGDIEGGKK